MLADFPEFKRPRNSTQNCGLKYEMLACAWLIARGYFVFKNIGMYGPVDIIAMKDEEIIKFDVKKAKFGRTGAIIGKKMAKTFYQRNHGIEILLVRDSGECFLEKDIRPYNTALGEYVFYKKCRGCNHKFTTLKKSQMYCKLGCRKS